MNQQPTQIWSAEECAARGITLPEGATCAHVYVGSLAATPTPIEGTEGDREAPLGDLMYDRYMSYCDTKPKRLMTYSGWIREHLREFDALRSHPPIAAAPEWLDDLEKAAEEVLDHEAYFKDKVTEVWQAAEVFPALNESRERYWKAARPAAILELIKLVRASLPSPGERK